MTDTHGAGAGGEGGGLDTAGAGGTSVETGVGSQSTSGTPDVPSYSPGSEPTREAYGVTGLTDEPDDDGVFDFFTNLGGTSPATGAPPEVTTQPPVSPAPSAVSPAQVPPAQAPQPAEQVAQPAAQTAQAPQPPEGQAPVQVETPPGPATPTVETFLAGAVQNRAQIVEQLARDPRFTPTDEQLALFDSDPRAAFASMAANMHYESMVAAASMVQQLVPQLIQSQVVAAQQEKEVEAAFQTSFPDLNLREQRVMGAVLNAAQLVKAQADPNMPREKRIELIGSMARMLLGQASQPAPAPRQPAPAPFQPARSGGGGTAILPNGSPWDGMGMSFD